LKPLIGYFIRSKTDCEKSCPPSVITDICTQPVTPGNCFGYFERWAHEDGVCKKFVYGGCGGNDNNFR